MDNHKYNSSENVRILKANVYFAKQIETNFNVLYEWHDITVVSALAHARFAQDPH